MVYSGCQEKATFWLPVQSLFRAPWKKVIFTVSENSLLRGGISKGDLFDFFEKIEFSRCNKNSIFFCYLKFSFLGRSEMNKFIIFRKIAFWGRHEKAIFSVSEKQDAIKKKHSFGFRNIAFSRRHKKTDFLVSEKTCSNGATKKGFFRIPKNAFFTGPWKSDFYGFQQIAL